MSRRLRPPIQTIRRLQDMFSDSLSFALPFANYGHSQVWRCSKIRCIFFRVDCEKCLSKNDPATTACRRSFSRSLLAFECSPTSGPIEVYPKRVTQNPGIYRPFMTVCPITGIARLNGRTKRPGVITPAVRRSDDLAGIEDAVGIERRFQHPHHVERDRILHLGQQIALHHADAVLG